MSTRRPKFVVLALAMVLVVGAGSGLLARPEAEADCTNRLLPGSVASDCMLRPAHRPSSRVHGSLPGSLNTGSSEAWSTGRVVRGSIVLHSAPPSPPHLVLRI